MHLTQRPLRFSFLAVLRLVFHGTLSIRTLTLSDVAARPDVGGTAGRAIALLANMFVMRLGGSPANIAQATGARGAQPSAGPSSRGGARRPAPGPARGGAVAPVGFRGSSLAQQRYVYHYDVVIKPVEDKGQLVLLQRRIHQDLIC